MEWLDPKEMADGEVVVRLVQEITAHTGTDAQAYWWGKSVHQIAYVSPEGDVFCRGKQVERGAINGWLPLPRGPRI